MIYLDEHLLLGLKMLDLVLLDYLLFSHDFQGVYFSFAFELNQFYSPKSAIA